jgi:hypothetical protein
MYGFSPSLFSAALAMLLLKGVSITVMEITNTSIKTNMVLNVDLG